MAGCSTKNYCIYLKRSPVNFIPSILITEERGKAAWRLETGRLQWEEAVFSISRYQTFDMDPRSNAMAIGSFPQS